MPVSSIDSELATHFLAYSRSRMIGQNWPNLRECIESLSDEQIWSRPNEASNSIGNLVLHLNGNLTQLLLVTFDGIEDKRDRPREFAAVEQPSGAELINRLGATIELVDQLFVRLTPDDLLRSYTIMGRPMSGLNVIYRVVEHFGQHYGQIIYITKSLTGKDLGFYARTQSKPAK